MHDTMEQLEHVPRACTRFHHFLVFSHHILLQQLVIFYPLSPTTVRLHVVFLVVTRPVTALIRMVYCLVLYVKCFFSRDGICLLGSHVL